MQILVTKRFEEELKTILTVMLEQLDFQTTKNFKLYLDTIIINIPTKIQKYKTSQFFNHDAIKEIDYSGLKIFFYEEKESKNIVLLSIS
jgi:hypothetical protein